MKQVQQLNPQIDQDGDFKAMLRKTPCFKIWCNKDFYFRNKETGECFPTPLLVKGYLYDKDGNPLSEPEIPSVEEIFEEFEVVAYDG